MLLGSGGVAVAWYSVRCSCSMTVAGLLYAVVPGLVWLRLVVGLRGWCSMVTGVGSDHQLRCSRPVRRSRIPHRSISSGWSGHCCSGTQNIVKRGKTK